MRASIEATFDSLITQMGRQNETPEGKPLPMIIETKPGGRWYRDLGGDNGHLWGLCRASSVRPARNLGAAVMSTGAAQQLDLPAVRSRRRHDDLVQAHRWSRP